MLSPRGLSRHWTYFSTMTNDSNSFVRPPEPPTCIVMFSGGLDSTIAAHLLSSQGLDVRLLHFVLPFESGMGRTHAAVRDYAQRLGLPLIVREEGEEFLSVVKDPHFGYGKNANPCVDCRISRVRKAGDVMREIGARFIATGEVVGQRPMSQRRDAMDAVAKRSGLKGLLLRPLSAKVLKPTVPEEQGWVDRDRLMGITGRGRRDQLDYARAHGLRFSAPGGGCVLTQPVTGARFEDLRTHTPDFDLTDFKLLAYGRHFRLSPSCKLVMGRNEQENRLLTDLARDSDYLLRPVAAKGPEAVGRGEEASPGDVSRACSLLARYCRPRPGQTVAVEVRHRGTRETIETEAASEEACDWLMIRPR